MRQDHSAKLSRRTVALENLIKSLQAWKDAKTDKEIWELLSGKSKRVIENSKHDNSEVMQEVRKVKIRLSEERIEILERLVQ